MYISRHKCDQEHNTRKSNNHSTGKCHRAALHPQSTMLNPYPHIYYCRACNDIYPIDIISCIEVNRLLSMRNTIYRVVSGTISTASTIWIASNPLLIARKASHLSSLYMMRSLYPTPPHPTSLPRSGVAHALQQTRPRFDRS